MGELIVASFLQPHPRTLCLGKSRSVVRPGGGRRAESLSLRRVSKKFNAQRGVVATVRSRNSAQVEVDEPRSSQEFVPDSTFHGEIASRRGVVDVIGNARVLEFAGRVDGEEAIRRNGERACIDWKTDERVQKSCEAGSALRVAVLVSGGVDSSAALRLLCDSGHSCTAYYLKIWFQEDFENFWSACPWEEDLSFAQRVCDEAGVELKVVHLTDAYWRKVVTESLSEIRAGRTPNPDMLCNSKIKFGEFLEHITDSSFDRIASGHYARVERMGACSNGEEEQAVQLCLSSDNFKDQTYFLSQLSQCQVSRLMFPLGGLSKKEVRDVAEAMGLCNKQRKDSQGICFLGKVKFSEFIERHLGEKEGCMLEAETGEVLGVHKGFWFYTIGQRQGLRLSNGPWFVVAKDVEHNVVFISRKYFSEKRRRSFRVGSLNWISGHPPSDLTNMRCKVRHGPKFYHCNFQFDVLDSSEETILKLPTAVVSLAEDDQGLAPGQYAAFYQGDICLGSGIISEALGDEQAVNVSPVAIEAAKTRNDPQLWNNSKDAKNRSATVLKGDDVQASSGRKSVSTNMARNVDDVKTVSTSTPLSSARIYSQDTDSRKWPVSSILSKCVSWLNLL